MGYWNNIPDDLLELQPQTILIGFRGSIAQGTYEENITHDDYDVMGLYIPPKNCLFGLDHMDTIERMVEEKLSQKRNRTWDIVYYSVPKYLSLIEKQNPNVLSLLWITDKHYIHRTRWGDLLISERKKLLSKDCYHSFCGYAHGQLHRMTHIDKTGRLGAKRKELIEKFGYDVKNASHLIRLLHMGIDALITGEIIVERPENKMLLSIKRGEWPLQKVMDLSDKLFDDMRQALLNTGLPNHISHDYINNLCVTILEGFYWEDKP